ncbi:hypothetical protein A3Q56_06559 [Intoshia linei]|uniref:CCHC-type domain-containing protein n=1 Tax=Intoshia linei TaxID=1819745 RepID=A0A177AUJ2_9BILA|nr:hypothetical protein A3Q56_06559 [Intoshia linei]
MVSCYNCGKSGNISRFCKTKDIKPNIRAIYDNKTSQIDHYVDAFDNDGKTVTLKFIIDTGSQVNCINKKFYSLFLISKTGNTVLFSADGSYLKNYGVVQLKLTNGYTLPCYITNTDNILGCRAVLKIKICRILDNYCDYNILNSYSDVICDIPGRCNTGKHTINLKSKHEKKVVDKNTFETIKRLYKMKNTNELSELTNLSNDCIRKTIVKIEDNSANCSYSDIHERGKKRKR